MKSRTFFFYGVDSFALNLTKGKKWTPLLPELDSGILTTNRQAARKIITRKLGNQACEFISEYIQDFDYDNVSLFDTRYRDEIDNIIHNDSDAIVNLNKANDYKRINKFFETVNKKLPEGGLFINSLETLDKRKTRILNKFPKYFKNLCYFGDFIFHRVFPKLKLTKKLYFSITKGYDRVLTKAEAFGRLYSCGFEVLEEKIVDDRLFFVAKKVKEPNYDMNPTYGPLIALRRIGKNKKIINVYKLRTMHPYSEYLQKYVYERNDLRKGGKLNNDFRISNLGKLFRKYWIDELPMIINFIKGDMKLIGGRPLSDHYFSLYSKELQQKRTAHKPGLIPPFYADMPETLDEIMESELKYLKAYEKEPLLTDLTYSFRILKNIVFKGKRSL